MPKRTLHGDREAIERVLASIPAGSALDVLVAMERAFGIAEGKWQAGVLNAFEDFATLVNAVRIRNRLNCSSRQALLQSAAELGTNPDNPRNRVRRESRKNWSG